MDDPKPEVVDQARESFVTLLSRPEGRAGLRALERRGALATALPEWDGIRCLPRQRLPRTPWDVH